MIRRKRENWNESFERSPSLLPPRILEVLDVGETVDGVPGFVVRYRNIGAEHDPVVFAELDAIALAEIEADTGGNGHERPPGVAPIEVGLGVVLHEEGQIAQQRSLRVGDGLGQGNVVADVVAFGARRARPGESCRTESCSTTRLVRGRTSRPGPRIRPSRS